jgi:SAM-dependent methyltransferase
MDYDAELRCYQQVLRRAWDIQRDDRVLDIGCGAGQTTRDAARLASSVLGVDTSAAAIERGRRLAEGLPNVRFELGDAQVYGFARAHFDVAISRFGTMFFADPVAAFTNIGSALRPGGRLVMLVWQAPERNDWHIAIHRVLGARSQGAGAFSLGDPPTVRSVLTAAGFTGIALTGVEEPVYYGPDVDSALDWVRGFTCTRELLTTDDALARLRETMAAHLRADGIWFDAAAWLVTAGRAEPRGRA